jgi:hypothetical protein
MSSIDLSVYREAKKTASSAIEGIAGLAENLQMQETAISLAKKAEDLRSDTFRLMIAGRFKNGKSTLLNALLGKTTIAVDLQGRGPMPVDDLPCTAVLTSINYSDRPYVRAFLKDGTEADNWDFPRYLRDATVKDDHEETQRFFSEIREFKIGFPNQLCQQGITLIDSPGTDDMPDRTAITLEAAARCDAAIVVYRSDVFAGLPERDFAYNVLEVDGTQVFTVVNMWDSRQRDSRFEAFVWNRLMKLMKGAPAFNGQSFDEQGIYFVDARMAEAGRIQNDPLAVSQSGIEHLEQKLTDFLMNERYLHHIERFVKGSYKQAALIGEQIERRKAGFAKEAAHLRDIVDAARPKLEAAQKRKEGVPLIIEKYRRDLHKELKTSFTSLVNEVRLGLPLKLKAYSLPSASKTFSLFYQRAMMNESFAFCEGYVRDALDTWAAKNGELENRATATMDRMFREIKEEVTEMENAYRQLYVEIGGENFLKTGRTDTSAMSWFERALWAGVGFVMHDVGAAVAGGVLGWRGFVATLGGYLAGTGAAVALGVTGFAVIPLLAVSGLLAQLIAGKVFLEGKIKEKVVDIVLNGSPKSTPNAPGLRDAAQVAIPKLEAAINREFDKIKKDLMVRLNEILDQEEANIRQMLEDSERDAASKHKLLRSLDTMQGRLREQENVLRSVVTKVRQQFA